MRHDNLPFANPFIRPSEESPQPLIQRGFSPFGNLPQAEQIQLPEAGTTSLLKDYLGAVAQQAAMGDTARRTCDEQLHISLADDRLYPVRMSPERRHVARSYLTDVRKAHRRLGLPAEVHTGAIQEGLLIGDLAKEYCELNKASILQSVTTATGLPQLCRHLKSNLDSLLTVRRTVTRRNLDNSFSGRAAEPQLPDFFQFDIQTQRDIIALFGREWQELFRTMHSHKLLRKSLESPERWPLAFSSMTGLRNTMQRYSVLGPATICRLFLDEPHTYVSTLGRMQKEHNEEILARRTALGKEVLTPAEVHQVIQGLMDDPDVDAGIIKLRPGNKMNIGERDVIVSGQAFDHLIYTHLRLLGQVKYARDMPAEALHGVAIEDAPLMQAGAQLRRNYDGILQNITVSWASRAARQRECKSESLDQAAMTFVIEAELAHGQAAGPIRLWVRLNSKLADNEQVCDAITWDIIQDDISAETEGYMKRAAETSRQQFSDPALLGGMTIRQVIENTEGSNVLD